MSNQVAGMDGARQLLVSAHSGADVAYRVFERLAALFSAIKDCDKDKTKALAELGASLCVQTGGEMDCAGDQIEEVIAILDKENSKGAK